MGSVDHVREWVDGWVVSRGAAPPVAEPWGYTIRGGLMQSPGRHVLGAAGDAVREDDVRKVAESTRGLDLHLKVFADPARVVPWLGAGWEPYGSGDYLMATELRPAPVPDTPDGHVTHLWSRGGVTRILVTDADGTFAARGQVAPVGASAVVDQIETSPAHRRKGLGSLVMHTLHAAALAQGAVRAVLACTPEGRLLYESVGWKIVAPLTNAKYVGTP
ncbi:GNAT family N-acetyltransferase [Streptomyces sp. VRA16 Mangrove soil]|uniref:GNAT family N-acetyltransferase n=1 Tax=Streptomyces sp. VRA16 Mangrove soil TaxID=2817434 RepID=UPI001A9CBF7B|nr:GNAT family N-acetyltransferase [Streptomyces sp. VRA16 Mangrove soil]MBO1336156.1 GNAT family N-acetyltransferase [Streptomyces sp. VRA16 Mangrove soil]